MIEIKVHIGTRELPPEQGWRRTEPDGSVVYNIALHPSEPWEQEAAAILATAVREVGALIRQNRENRTAAAAAAAPPLSLEGPYDKAVEEIAKALKAYERRNGR